MERSNPVLARAVEDAITAAVGAPRSLADKLIQQEPRNTLPDTMRDGPAGTEDSRRVAGDRRSAKLKKDRT
jgi:hypothetical protein